MKGALAMEYDSKFKSQVMDEFFEAVLLLKDLDDCYRFFEDVCTINELRAMTQRMQVAKLLADKKTYSEIEELTKASTATISRINKCLVYGAGGYELVIERLKEKE
ncbi:MAG: YerC/YecD family TrpR-related protein [Firmicutes bacterium]|nr:YerC/YecD family TrpR-related protein [Bacillota bacterium]